MPPLQLQISAALPPKHPHKAYPRYVVTDTVLFVLFAPAFSVTLRRCPHCDFRSATQYSVKVHILRHHTKRHAFTCNKCGWSCNLKGDIMKHLRKKHGKSAHLPQQFVSRFCWITGIPRFTKQERQSFLHCLPTGNPMYKCRHCAVAFKTRHGLDKHMTTHNDFRGVGYVDCCIEHEQMHIDAVFESSRRGVVM